MGCKTNLTLFRGDPGNTVIVTTEAPGVNCAAGGIKVDLLDGLTNAIISTSYVCGGASAYQLWLNEGNTGDINQFFNSINGVNYIEVPINSSEISNLNTVVKELLPDLINPLEYYKDLTFVFEYTYGTSPYTGGIQLAILKGNIENRIGISAFFLNNSVTCQHEATMATYDTSSPAAINAGYVLYNNFPDVTGGDGTLLIKIWYSIGTFTV